MMKANHLLVSAGDLQNPCSQTFSVFYTGRKPRAGNKKSNLEILDRDIRKLGRVFRDCQSEILGLPDKNLNIEVNIQ